MNNNPEHHRASSVAYYAANRERVLTRQRAQKQTKYATNADFRAAVKARVKARNRVRNRWAVLKEWRAANPDGAREQRKRWNSRRRARVLGSSVLEHIDFDRVLRAANGLCGICGEALGPNIHFDHKVPLALGGAHSEANLQPAHPSCNRKKGARLPPSNVFPETLPMKQ
jgi:5-methylcytosine-specific restriction endonuclease McrA